MAEQHWVKYYRIKPENIHDDGTIDDDTPLYPYYSGSYHKNGPTEKFNEPIEYDQTSNTDHGLKSGRRLKDLRTGEEFETGLKRGFSVNGYVKGADGLLWTPAGDDSGAIIDPASEKYNTIPSEGYTDSVFNDKLDIVSDLTLPMYSQSGLVVLPTIVTADEDDLVRYYDYKYNGYNPERDSRNEQMLKKIKYRRLPEGFRYKIVKSFPSADDLNTANNLLKYVSVQMRNGNFEAARHRCEMELREDTFDDTNTTVKSDFINRLAQKDTILAQLLEDIYAYLCNRETNIDVWDTIEQAENIMDDHFNNTYITDYKPENYDPEQWFPKNIISSDERLKNIEGSADSNWIDFGDSHKKHIYDDFMKWYDNSCTQRDIANCLGDRL